MTGLPDRAKVLLDAFLKSPGAASVTILRRLSYLVKEPSRVVRLRDAVRRRPLILQIETTNVCNAACIFCAYTSTARPKGVMSLELFKRVVQEYAAMGGGAVTLTPVVGDALVDPHLLERLRILSAEPAIGQVSLTTNAIALARYSDPEVREMLRQLYCIQVSVGGLDAEGYRNMYGVDRFDAVRQGMERLLTLREGMELPSELNFAFRTNDSRFEERFRPQLDEYRRRGAFVSHIWTYANYSGVVQPDDARGLVVLEGGGRKEKPCAYASLGASICWDGNVTACGCADPEGSQLPIGHLEKETLKEILSGKRRAGVLEAFSKGTLPGICRKCSAYQSDIIFAEAAFAGVEPSKPLPLRFFQEFWGG